MAAVFALGCEASGIEVVAVLAEAAGTEVLGVRAALTAERRKVAVLRFLSFRATLPGVLGFGERDFF